MTEQTPPRPRQVTLAAWLIIIGSVMVVALVFDRLMGLHTLETQESVESFLSEPPGSDLDLGVDGVLTIIRTLSMVAAGCATAAAILGYQVLRRSRSARLALTVLAVPLFLTGMVTDGFVPAVVAASAAMLWLQPSRDWFRDGPSSLGTSSTPGSAGSAGPAPAPRPDPAPSAPSSRTPAPPVAPAAQVTAAPPAYPTQVARASARPPAVVWACVLTWICSGLTAAGAVLSGVVFALNPDYLLDEVHRQSPDLADQGVTDTVLMATTYAMLGFVVLWCLAAAVLALLTFRGVGWARVVLIVSASIAGAVSLLGSAMGGFLLVLTLIGAVVTVVLLARPEARPWFERR